MSLRMAAVTIWRPLSNYRRASDLTRRLHRPGSKVHSRFASKVHSRKNLRCTRTSLPYRKNQAAVPCPGLFLPRPLPRPCGPCPALFCPVPAPAAGETPQPLSETSFHGRASGISSSCTSSRRLGNSNARSKIFMLDCFMNITRPNRFSAQIRQHPHGAIHQE